MITSLTFKLVIFVYLPTICLPQGLVIPAVAVIEPRNRPEVFTSLDHVGHRVDSSVGGPRFRIYHGAQTGCGGLSILLDIWGCPRPGRLELKGDVLRGMARSSRASGDPSVPTDVAAPSRASASVTSSVGTLPLLGTETQPSLARSWLVRVPAAGSSCLTAELCGSGAGVCRLASGARLSISLASGIGDLASGVGDLESGRAPAAGSSIPVAEPSTGGLVVPAVPPPGAGNSGGDEGIAITSGLGASPGAPGVGSSTLGDGGELGGGSGSNGKASCGFFSGVVVSPGAAG